MHIGEANQSGRLESGEKLVIWRPKRIAGGDGGEWKPVGAWLPTGHSRSRKRSSSTSGRWGPSEDGAVRPDPAM